MAQAEELLEGRFAGVRVQRVPGRIVVRIRGATSVMGSEEPLYVVDGMEIAPGPGGALMGINPADITRIEVLKDIGSTSAYGVRGANGVILITTRRNWRSIQPHWRDAEREYDGLPYTFGVEKERKEHFLVRRRCSFLVEDAVRPDLHPPRVYGAHFRTLWCEF